MSARERQAEILAAALRDGSYLPARPQNRSDCKVLVKRGLLEPNGPMGYRPTFVQRIPPGPVPDRPFIDACNRGTGYHGRCKCGQPLTMIDDQGHRYARCGCGGMTR